jgi:hypothetical protein
MFSFDPDAIATAPGKQGESGTPLRSKTNNLPVESSSTIHQPLHSQVASQTYSCAVLEAESSGRQILGCTALSIPLSMLKKYKQGEPQFKITAIIPSPP